MIFELGAVLAFVVRHDADEKIGDPAREPVAKEVEVVEDQLYLQLDRDYHKAKHPGGPVSGNNFILDERGKDREVWSNDEVYDEER